MFFLTSAVTAQVLKPDWVQLMEIPNPDLGQLREAYEAYYRENPFQKNSYTQAYKRLMWAHARDNNGFLLGLSPDPVKYHEADYILRSDFLRTAESSPTSAWYCIGPEDFDHRAASKSYAPGAAHVYTVEQAPSDNQVLYAGTANAGVWKTTNKGQLWNPVTPFMMVSKVSALEIDFSNPLVVYFGGNGKIYKTTDGGINWNPTGDAGFQGLNISANDIVMHPSNNQIIWAVTNQGFFKTTSGGLDWDTLMVGIWLEIEFKPGDPMVMYAIKVTGDQTQFFKSTDGGNSFVATGVGYPSASAPDEQKRTEIAVTPAAPGIVYAYATGEANGGSGLYGIYVSHDEGENWTFQCCGTGPGGIPDSATNKNLCAWSEFGDDDGGQYYYDLALEVSPFDSNEVHANAVNHWVSYDGGVNWVCPAKWSHSDKVNYIHADIHDCRFYGNDWWWACDGGIFYSSTQFDTVQRMQLGIQGTDFWGFGMGEWDGENVLVGGTYHNGTLLKDDTTYINGWLSCMGGDNILGAVNYGYPRNIFSDYGKHKLSGNRTLPLTQLSNGMLPSSSYVIGETADMEFSPFAFNTIFISYDGSIWKSTDNGLTYFELYNFGTGKVTSIECSWQNPNVIYAAYYTSWWGTKSVYKTSDGGATWTNVSPPNGILNGNLSAPYDIAISADNDQQLWLARCQQSSTYNNLDGYKVFYSSDGGFNWNNITTPILNGEYPTNIEYQRSSNAVYLGTRRAVYYRNLSMPDWQLFNNNLPVSTVSNQILINYKERKIRNASNRSVWECDLYESPNTKAHMSADKTNIYCVRDSVHFTDHSVLTDSSASWLWSFPGGNPSSSTLRKPVVNYPNTGTYSVSLIVSDAFGTDSITNTNFITVMNFCSADTIPGRALQLDGTDGFASAPALNLNSNTVTLSCWIKPDGIQNDWSGIMFTRSSNSTSGLSMLANNEIRYHWNGGQWGTATGLFAPLNEWSHVALVIQATGATIYVNGVGFTHTVSLAADEFDGSFLMGVDPCCGNRHFKGLMDEVAVYDRALTQAEIRELMHLTRRPEDDLSLIAYYQFNEPISSVQDKVGIRHASLNQGALLVTSTGPFGGGSSFRTDITASGLTSFFSTGLDIYFNPSGTVPNGEVVCTRINLLPDVLPASFQPTPCYWILDNYGPNSTFSNPDSIRFSSAGIITSSDASTPEVFKLYSRSHHGDGPTWTSSIGQGGSAMAGSSGSVSCLSPISFSSEGQLILLNSGVPFQVQKSDEKIVPHVSIFPVPAKAGSLLTVKTNLEGNIRIMVFDLKGGLVQTIEFTESAGISTLKMASGMYFYMARSNGWMQTGSIVLE